MSLRVLLGDCGYADIHVTPRGGIFTAIGLFVGQLVGRLPLLPRLVYALAFSADRLVRAFRRDNDRKWPLGYGVVATRSG